MVQRAIRTGAAVVQGASLYDYELEWATDAGTQWYRSKDKKGGIHPFPSFMMNKKWTLEEDFNNHMLRFQQVSVSFKYLIKNYILTFQAGLTMIAVDFKVVKGEDDPEPLRMEHFYFPLGIWIVAIILSTIVFLVEIIIHRRRKSKTDVTVRHKGSKS